MVSVLAWSPVVLSLQWLAVHMLQGPLLQTVWAVPSRPVKPPSRRPARKAPRVSWERLQVPQVRLVAPLAKLRRRASRAWAAIPWAVAWLSALTPKPQASAKPKRRPAYPRLPLQVASHQHRPAANPAQRSLCRRPRPQQKEAKLLNPQQHPLKRHRSRHEIRRQHLPPAALRQANQERLQWPELMQQL